MSNTASNAADDRPLVRLGGPEDIVAAIPYLLGFHPRESIVAVGLRGRRRRVCLAIRLDLPGPELERDVADLLSAHLRHAGAKAAILLIVTEKEPAAAISGAGSGSGSENPVPERAPAELPRQGLVDAVRAALDLAQIRVQDLLCVRSERWWSYLCAQPGCCPPEGNPVRGGGVTALAAATAVEGRAVLPDRDALARTLAPVESPPSRARRQLFDGAARDHRDQTAAIGTDQARRFFVAAITAAVEARADRAEPLADTEAARFAVALTDVESRDACMRWLNAPLADAAEGLWLELLRSAVPPYAAAPATLVALHAYARGDGAFARICADRALGDDPGYSMAHLIHESLDRGLGPVEIRELASCLKPSCADT
jgi:hypothetical protein